MKKSVFLLLASAVVLAGCAKKFNVQGTLDGAKLRTTESVVVEYETMSEPLKADVKDDAFALSGKVKKPEQTLFDIAMHTVRENRDDENVAWVASMRIRNPELLTELVLGASEFVVSEWAVSVRLDDEQLIRIIREIEDNEEKWISPLDVEPDDAWGASLHQADGCADPSGQGTSNRNRPRRKR